VVVPEPTMIAAPRPGRSDVPCCAPAGATAMLDVVTPCCAVSRTSTMVPTLYAPALAHVPAGAAPAGTCASAGAYSVGTMVDVRETAQQGVTTSSIAVAPAGAQQGTSDLPGRGAAIIVGSGTT